MLVEAAVDIVQIALDRKRSLRERFEQICEVVRERVTRSTKVARSELKSSVAEPAMLNPVRPAHETF